MESSTFTKVSKEIGWEGEPISLPTQEVAETLYKAVTDSQSTEAFRQVFKYYRFAKTPETFAEEETAQLINEAFQIGSKYFKTVYNEVL